MFPSCFYNSSFDWFWGELASWPQRRYLLQRRRWQSRWGKIYHLKKTKKRKFFIFQNSKIVFRYERTSPHFATSHDFHMFIGIFFEAFLRRVGVPSIGSTSMCQATDKVKWLELGITREFLRRSLTNRIFGSTDVRISSLFLGEVIGNPQIGNLKTVLK